MISIRNYPNISMPQRLSGTSKIFTGGPRAVRSSPFQNILAAFETGKTKNTHKSKGLTIADYRARAIFTKAHFRPQPRPARAEAKNCVSHRFTGSSSEPVASNSPLTSGRKIEGQDSIDPIEKSTKKPRSQAVVLNDHQIIEQNVQEAAAKYDLPSRLIKAVIRAESNFKVDAVSSAGAQGLMQLMPATAEELGVKNPFDIRQNIEGGSRYLRKMLDRFGGNVAKALAAYNAGPGTVTKYNGRVPYPETRQYVKRVLRFAGQMT
jgi:hypothetical protein